MRSVRRYHVRRDTQCLQRFELLSEKRRPVVRHELEHVHRGNPRANGRSNEPVSARRSERETRYQCAIRGKMVLPEPSEAIRLYPTGSVEQPMKASANLENR